MLWLAWPRAASAAAVPRREPASRRHRPSVPEDPLPRLVYMRPAAPSAMGRPVRRRPARRSPRPRPQRLSDRMWQSNVSNARLQRVILFGGAAVGKSEVMPASPELQGAAADPAGPGGAGPPVRKTPGERVAIGRPDPVIGCAAEVLMHTLDPLRAVARPPSLLGGPCGPDWAP